MLPRLAACARSRAAALAAVIGLVWLAGSCRSTVPTPAPTPPAVNTPTVSGITISGLQGAMAIGDVRVLKATARYADNTEEDVTSKAAWKSGDPAVFAVTTAGVLTATGKGLTGVEVSYLGKTQLTMGVVDQPGCTYKVSSVFVSFDRGVNSGTSQVATQPGCEWTAGSDSDWLAVGAVSRVGSGSVSYQMPFRDGPLNLDARVGHVTVRWDTPTQGQNVEVTQTGGCSVAAIGPLTMTIGADGGRVHWDVSAGTHPVLGPPIAGVNPWQIVSAPDWITTFPAIGAWQFGGGGSDFSTTAAPNPSSSPRSGTIVLCSTSFTLTQAGR